MELDAQINQWIIDLPILQNDSNSAIQLKQLCSMSQYVRDSITQYPWMLPHIIDAVKQSKTVAKMPLFEYVTHYHHWDIQILNETQQLALLRQVRHLGMLTILWRDMLNLQPIETSLIEVSWLADTLILQAYEFAYTGFEARYGTPMNEHGKQELYILGMGKLGGKELNFSSDIDLIFTYPEVGEFNQRRKPFEYQQFFIKVAQKLIHLLNTQTIDGQVYRVDMRLRPFGDSGPLVLPFSGLENYYESQGRSWERFALLKARILNNRKSGDDPNKLALANIIRPFIYRRYVDFSIIESLRDLKQKIVQEVRRRQLTNNIKLGAGGIREVEFLVQSFQLIYAGRIPAFKTASIFEALQVIKAETLLPAAVVDDLHACYLVLRKTEHTLQQFANAQTQTLPDDNEQRALLVDILQNYLIRTPALLQHFADSTNISLAFIETVQQRIHLHFQSFIEVDEPSDNEQNIGASHQDIWHTLDWPEPPDNFVLGGQDASTIWTTLVALKKTVNKGHIGERGETVLAKLLPLFLSDIHSLANNHLVAIESMCTIINAITSRTAYLELIMENAAVREQLIMFGSQSSWLIEHISAYPVLLDELIHPQYLQRTPHDLSLWRDELTSELQQALLRIEPDDEETLIHAMRQFKLAQRFRIAAADILDYLPIVQVSDKLTILAEVLTQALLRQAWQQTAARLGEPEGFDLTNMGIGMIAYGKLGGLELSYTSDLDLVFVHECSDGVNTKGGKRNVSAQQFYIKLVQRFVSLASTKTLLGDVYEIDLRLRPSGNSGLLICHIDTFANYQANEAWIWEHQSLCRARMIAGSASLQTEFESIRRRIITQPRSQNELQDKVRNMRQKMREHLGEKDKGALADIEFLTQYWCLQNAAAHPQIIQYSDNLRQLDALSQAHIISDTVATTLTQTYLTLRHHKHHEALKRSKVEKTPYYETLAQSVNQIWQDTFNTELSSKQ